VLAPLLGERAFEVSDQTLWRWAWNYLNELPPVLTPVIENVFGGVNEQRHRRVFPLRCAHNHMLTAIASRSAV